MYPSGTATTTHDSKQHKYWVELVRVCRLAVAAATARCSYCDKREPAPAKRGTGYQKGAASRNFRTAGRQGGTYMAVIYLVAPWMRPFHE